MLVAVLQVGAAIAPQVPQFNQGETGIATLTFFDSVTQAQVDPDGSVVSGSTQNPDGSTTTLTATRTAIGAYQVPIAFPQVGTYGLSFVANQGSQRLELASQATVVAAYVSPNSLAASQWIFVSASSATMPYQAQQQSPQAQIAADLRAGSVTIDFWSPADGDIIEIKDWYDLAGTQVLTVVATTGTLLEDPNNPGTYVQQARCVPPTGYQRGFVGKWRYSLQLAAWGRCD